MRYPILIKILIIIFLPLLVFLLVSDFVVFNDSFYKEKFIQYNVQQNVANATALHQKVINFVQGKSLEIPNRFNEREKQHLWDVRKTISASRTLLYLLLVLFAFLLLWSARIIKSNKEIKYFIGKAILFGSLLTIGIAVLLFLLINLNFPAAFEAFHSMLFKSGTYAFDPAKEIIVNLYPEGLFMDLGAIISLWVVMYAFVLMLSGAFLIYNVGHK